MAKFITTVRNEDSHNKPLILRLILKLDPSGSRKGGPRGSGHVKDLYSVSTATAGISLELQALSPVRPGAVILACFLDVESARGGACHLEDFRGWNRSGLKWDSDLPPGPKSHSFFWGQALPAVGLGVRLFDLRRCRFFLLHLDDARVLQADRVPIEAVSRPAFAFSLQLAKKALAARWKARERHCGHRAILAEDEPKELAASFFRSLAAIAKFPTRSHGAAERRRESICSTPIASELACARWATSRY